MVPFEPFVFDFSVGPEMIERVLLLHSVTLLNFKTNMLQLNALHFGKRKTNNARSPQNLELNPKTTEDLIMHQTMCPLPYI